MQLSVMYVKMMGVNNVLNYEARLIFVTMMCEPHQGDDQWIKRWMFTDVATFDVSGRVNTHNYLIWGTENPDVSYELQRASPKQNVWCRVTSEKVYGPFFFKEETVVAVNYLDMIERYVVPRLQQDGILDIIIYRRDGAPPHWAIIVREQLNHIFNDHWCGHDGPILWSSNSPDLTPPDFFVWGYIK